MRNLSRVLAGAAMFALVFSIAPLQAATAPTCTDQWYACINISGQQAEPEKTLGDIECSLEYNGCLARKLKFW